MERRLLLWEALAGAAIVGWVIRAWDLGPDLAWGLPTRDLFDHLWLHQWLARSLAEGSSLLTPQVIAWPDGGVVLHPDPTGFALYALFAWAVPPVVAFNLSLWAQLWLGCLAAWLLATEVTGSTRAGWVGGLAFALSPYLLGQLVGGETETLAVAPLVLALWGLERARRRPGWRWGLAAGLLGSLAALASWYHGAFWALYACAWALRVRRPVPVGAAALGAIVAVAGPAWLYSRALQDPANLFQGPPLLDYLELYPATLGGMVTDPWGLLPFWPERAGQGLTRVSSLGAVPLLLALFAWVRDGRGSAWWAALGGLALVLSLGPVLAPWDVPLPGRILGELPVFGLMRIPHRWMVLVALALAVGVARAVQALDLGWRGLAGVTALLALDGALFSGAPLGARVDVAPPPVLALVPGTGPILELPPRFLDDDARGRYLAWQPSHGRPIPYSLLMTGLSPTLAAEPLVAAVAALDRLDPIAARPDDARQVGRQDLALAVAGAAPPGPRAGALAELGIEAVVLHGDLLHPDDREPVRDLLLSSLGLPSLEVDGATVWDLRGTP